MHIHPDWFLTPQRAAVHVPTKTAVIADVHLGYNESRRTKGDAVPVGSLSALLTPLEQLANAGVRYCIVAGDLLESPTQLELAFAFIERLSRMGIKITGIIAGNHDGDLSALDEIVPTHGNEMRLGNWLIQHGDESVGADAVVHGHVHPCIRRQGINGPCFLFAHNRLILPAYSPDAAGVNINRIDGVGRFNCYAILNNRIEYVAIQKNRRVRRGSQRS